MRLKALLASLLSLCLASPTLASDTESGLDYYTRQELLRQLDEETRTHEALLAELELIKDQIAQEQAKQKHLRDQRGTRIVIGAGLLILAMSTDSFSKVGHLVRGLIAAAGVGSFGAATVSGMQLNLSEEQTLIFQRELERVTQLIINEAIANKALIQKLI
jgi:hypothetical protein